MKSINLLIKIPSLRNTIKPDTPAPGQIARKQKLLRIGALLLFMGLCASYGFWLYEPKKVITNKGLAKTGDNFGSALAGSGKKEQIAYSPRGASSPPKKRPKRAMKADKLKLATIVTRPVAKDASIVKSPSPVWYVRFAVCMYKKNCDEVRSKLAKKGIKAFVKRGVSPILMHRVVMGPWMTVSDAKLARAKLDEIRVKSSFFTAGNRSYLSTLPVADPASARKTLARVKALGYRAENKSAKSPQKIYKVYNGSYENRRLAEVVMKKFTAIGIQCVLEKHI